MRINRTESTISVAMMKCSSKKLKGLSTYPILGGNNKKLLWNWSGKLILQIKRRSILKLTKLAKNNNQELHLSKIPLKINKAFWEKLMPNRSFMQKQNMRSLGTISPKLVNQSFITLAKSSFSFLFLYLSVWMITT